MKWKRWWKRLGTNLLSFPIKVYDWHPKIISIVIVCPSWKLYSKCFLLTYKSFTCSCLKSYSTFGNSLSSSFFARSVGSPPTSLTPTTTLSYIYLKLHFSREVGLMPVQKSRLQTFHRLQSSSVAMMGLISGVQYECRGRVWIESWTNIVLIALACRGIP